MMPLNVLIVSCCCLIPVTFGFVSPASTTRRFSVAEGLSRKQHTGTSSSSLAVTPLTLYGSQGSRSPLVNWALEELNLDYTMGDLKDNPHPFGQVPCLTDPDKNVMVFESGAILIYLHSLAVAAADCAPDNESRQKDAQVLSWVSWANASLDPICFLETPDGKVYDTGLKRPNRRIDKLNDILEEKQFLCDDDTFTVADVAVSSYLLYVVQFFPDIDLSSRGWPHVVRYMGQCASRPSYGKAYGERIQTFLLRALADMGSSKPNQGRLFGVF